ncbi:translation initiation factor eIF-3b like protein [Goodea atripinnis]|uniref:Eukaryotic translation initiation factor 3 subunit B n=1 Tax=Goodea atripinnis TaxID=208336 RepID=A0ABV0PC35_9TELE
MQDTVAMVDDPEYEEEEPSFSDPEDFDDDIEDEELLEDILREKPQEADGIDSVIVVDNVPQVGPERLDKLKNVIHKIFSKFGRITTEFYPDADGMTKGYDLMCFSLSVVFYPGGNMRHWIEDSDCRDQYSVIYEAGERTAIFSNDAKDPILAEERARWTETYVRWSPKGTYLATFHQRGIALWGGEKFKQIQRFSHQGVSLIDFSPCERYVVTFSPLMDTKEDPQAIIIWDILTGQKKRGFHCESSAHWPIFKDFSWSPGDNILAFWVPEDKDIPARVTLMQLPSRQEIRVRNLFNVVDCKLHWQRNGDYLCVKVDRTPKGTQGVVTNFEIFRMREKQVPVDVVEMKEMFDKQQANSIFWSPQGQFMVLAGLRSMNGALAFVDTSDCTMMNIAEHYMASDVEWDPTGRYVVDNAYWLWTFQGRLLQKNNKDRFCQLLWRPRPPTLLSADQIKVLFYQNHRLHLSNT